MKFAMKENLGTALFNEIRQLDMSIFEKLYLGLKPILILPWLNLTIRVRCLDNEVLIMNTGIPLNMLRAPCITE
jgi:hypothetical protein